MTNTYYTLYDSADEIHVEHEFETIFECLCDFYEALPCLKGFKTWEYGIVTEEWDFIPLKVHHY